MAFLLFCLFVSLSVAAPPAVICGDVCSVGGGNQTCGSFTFPAPASTVQQFESNIQAGSICWFTAVIDSSSVPQSGIAFTNQVITVGTQTVSAPDAFVNFNGGTTSSTSYSGSWTTTSGTGCGNVFLSGVASNILFPTSTNFQWCGVFQSQTIVTGMKWSFGAACYPSTSNFADYNAINVKSSDSCSSTCVGLAGTPCTHRNNNLLGIGTAQAESTNEVGLRTTIPSTNPCVCPITFAPTTAPTRAPTRTPTSAPTERPTSAPTERPTSAPTNAPTPPTAAPTTAPTRAPTERPTVAPTGAPTERPTSAPTPPTAAPTTAPTRAPTAPTAAPTRAPTGAPTERPTSAPTEQPTVAPTRAPTPPTEGPTVGPTNAPTERPTRAPTGAPTERPTSAPTPPTEAPTTAPTNAPTPPTTAPTTAPTNAPTERPTRAPTEQPTAAPSRAPTAPTAAPTKAPTNAPTERPTVAPTAPTETPTVAPTRAPTEQPTKSPSPPTARPTRAPTAPTEAPTTVPPVTPPPTAPIDICTRQFTATFTLTYDQMTHGYVTGTLVYDEINHVLAFYYTNQTYQEIYQFNQQNGYGNVNGQSVYRISPNGTCAPCARYQNNWAFPVFYNVSGVSNPYPNGPVGPDGCQNYTVPTDNNNFAQYFGLHANGTLCYIGNQGRNFVISDVVPCGTYSPSYVTPPAGCVCSTPQDIAFTLDRSSSIDTKSTYIYRQFIQEFVASYYFNQATPQTSTQLGIVQWGNLLNPTTPTYCPVGLYGSTPFTMDPVNAAVTASQIGCCDSKAGAKGTPCNFCQENSNLTSCLNDGGTTVYKTCTSCGLWGAGQLFLDTTNYKRRAQSSQVIIMITDGNANTLNSSWDPTGNSLCCGDGNLITGSLVPGRDPNCDDGLWQTYSPLGCFTDINATRDAVQQLVPGVNIFAIGVGSLLDINTLSVIASSPANVFFSATWSQFLSQLQQIITLTCVEPDPITSCGTGEGACGFCACGATKLPDGIIPPNLCDQIVIQPVGQCFTGLPVPLNCTAPPCETPQCIPTLNNGNGGCINVSTVCPTVDPCYEPLCLFGGCIPKAVCNASLSPLCTATCAPTLPPNVTDECYNTTGGLGCGPNGVCNATTLTCICLNGFHGLLCQFCPTCPECVVDSECNDGTNCTTDACVFDNGLSVLVCNYSQVNCDDGDACTLDFCNATGCQHLPASICDDNDGCTIDSCDSVTGLCVHNNFPQVACFTNFSDTCNLGYCDPNAPLTAQCFQQPIPCPRDNNCTLAYCVKNATTNLTYCTNTTLDCGNALVGIIAGLTAGVIAAIVAAALIAGCALAGGGAYAAQSALHESTETEVLNNPLYCGDGGETFNPIHGHGHGH